jgi:hypothetical protein
LRRTAFALIALSACLFTVPAGAAPQAGFQLEFHGVAVTPMGSLESSGQADARDLFGSGPGAAFAAIVRYHRSLGAGVRVEWTHTHKEGTYEFDDTSGLPFTTPPPGPGPFDIRRSLIRIPVEAVVHYEIPMGAGVAMRIEGGAGLTTFTERVKLRSGPSELFNIAGYQQNFSYSAGLSLATRWIPAVDVLGGVRYDQALTDDGDVWRKKDNPKFVTGAIGIRFPRY